MEFSSTMPAPLKFLVIDDNADSRFLLVKTLLRKFPNAVIHECQSSHAALEMAKAADLAAIISHRTTETAGIELLRELRATNPNVPMVMVSGVDRNELAMAAGADRFLLYDEWLRVGTVVEELVASRSRTAVAIS
jgi:CheY-like chemotaxis protein